VIGGNDVKHIYKECEFYDITKNEWTKMSDMNQARDSAACSIFDSKWIYAFCGRIKFNPKEITETIEVYEIEKDIW